MSVPLSGEINAWCFELRRLPEEECKSFLDHFEWLRYRGEAQAYFLERHFVQMSKDYGLERAVPELREEFARRFPDRKMPGTPGPGVFR